MPNNPFPNRQSTRLDYYDYSRKGSYFITICSRNHENIFRDADWTLTKAGTVVEKRISNIFGIGEYVIMPNHVHMIITFDESGKHILGREINAFKGLVTKECGGSVWQRGYYDRILKGREEYADCAEYIQNNPSNWADDKFNRHAERTERADS